VYPGKKPASFDSCLMLINNLAFTIVLAFILEALFVSPGSLLADALQAIRRCHLHMALLPIHLFNKRFSLLVFGLCWKRYKNTCTESKI